MTGEYYTARCFYCGWELTQDRECTSMWDEVWSELALDLQPAFKAAMGL